MTVTVHADLPRRQLPAPVFLDGAEASRLADFLGWDEQIELDMPPSEVLAAVARARDLGLAHDAFDAVEILAHTALAMGHGIDFRQAFRRDTVGQEVAVAGDPIDAPSYGFCVPNLLETFAALGLPADAAQDTVGVIDPAMLLKHCDVALPTDPDFPLDRYVGILRDIALYAQKHGVRVVWA